MFPEEKFDVQVTLVEADQILSAFDEKLRNYTEILIKKRESMNIVQASVMGESVGVPPVTYCIVCTVCAYMIVQ